MSIYFTRLRTDVLIALSPSLVEVKLTCYFLQTRFDGGGGNVKAISLVIAN